MKKWTSLLASAFLLFFLSCNEMDKYYDNDRHATSVSVGNAWDYLESRGNFTNFLAAVQKVHRDGARREGASRVKEGSRHRQAGSLLRMLLSSQPIEHIIGYRIGSSRNRLALT